MVLAEEQGDILSAQVRGSLRAGYAVGRVGRGGRIRAEDCDFGPAVGVERITANGRCLNCIAQRRVEIAERVNQIGAGRNLNCRGKGVRCKVDVTVKRFVSRRARRRNPRQAAWVNHAQSVTDRRGEPHGRRYPITDVRKKTRGGTRSRKETQRVFMRPRSAGMVKEAHELGPRRCLQAKTGSQSQPPVQSSTEGFLLKSHVTATWTGGT